MDRFHEMQVFVAVADAGGFAKAAHALNSSPPTVTRMIAALEERLRVRLFNRTTRRLGLTEPGRRFLEQARRVLTELDLAEQEVAGLSRIPAGQLTLTASLTFGRGVLAPIVSGFLEAHPHVRVSMLLFDRLVDLVDEGIDVAIRIAALPDSTLVASQVGEVRRVLVASPAYLARAGTPEKPEDLRRHRIIGQTAMMPDGEWRHVVAGKPARLTLEPWLETNDVQAGLNVALAGEGITTALSYMVAGALEAGQLVPVLAAHMPEPVPVHLIYAQRRIVAPKVRAFVDFAGPRLRAALTAARW
jgi:DNA-binding transcriptional LysR family regulator